MQVMLAEKAKELLQNGTVNRVLGWKKGEFAYDITPAMFTTAEQIDAEFVYDDFCANNLSKYLIQESRKEGKVLVFLKPCDTYSFTSCSKNTAFGGTMSMSWVFPATGRSMQTA